MTTIPNGMEGGFVRVPDAWIYLPISPQAKMLLVAFCAHADEAGKSWCSYEQLGEIVQRCKGSISSYVKELRDAGLIDCKQQRYGNGYNYRLLITLIGWRDLIAHWASLRTAKKARAQSADQPAASRRQAPAPSSDTTHEPTSGNGTIAADKSSSTPCRRKASSNTQNSERRVQPADHKDPSGPKNQIHQNQTPGVVWTNEDENAWLRFRPSDRDPISAVSGKPDPDLLKKVILVAETAMADLDMLSEADAKSRCHSSLGAFAARRRLSVDDEHMTQAASALAGVAKTQAAIDAAVAALDAAWKPFWRRLSTPEQIVDCCRLAAEAHLPPLKARQRAGRFQTRAWLAQMVLRKMPERS